jgi:DNA-binding transcriptional LysR family regulator
MAKGGKARQTGRKTQGRPGGGRAASGAQKSPRPVTKRAPAPAPEPPALDLPSVLRLGVIPGATPGKWVDTWQARFPQVPVEIVPLEVRDQREALYDAAVDLALVRLPIDREGLSVIPLYDEVPVVVAAKDSHLMAADELTLADLEGEVVIVPADDVLSLDVPGAVAPRFAPPQATADAVAVAATGVSAVIVPMSLARALHRKDADHRVLTDGPTSSVALAWVSERTTDAVDLFVGIVRGRTQNSSRA